MFFGGRNFYVEIIVILLTELAFGQKLDQLTAKQRSRLKPVFEDAEHKNLTVFDKNTKDLFKIIHGRPENKDLESENCENQKLIMPDFSARGRRISEVKCLENLWKMRFYDEALINMVLCGIPYNTIQLNEHFGGYDTAPGEFPHMGAIGWETSDDSWLFMCEGALISEKFMITAAHCSRLTIPDVRVVDPLPKIVRFGEPNISDKEAIGKAPEDVFIHRFIIHPRYRFSGKYYDIAIVELQKAITFSIKVHPSCIWTNLFPVAGEAELTGWNVIKSNKTVNKMEYNIDMFDAFMRLKMIQMATQQETHGNDSLNNPVMQVAEVNILNIEKCEKLTIKKVDKSWKGFLFHQMCAERSVNVNNTFQVDIGGVLQAPINIPEFTDWKIHYIIGVRSFTFGCNLSKALGVYTKLSTFVDWIEDVVWGAESK
ncbi:unnamed protein product [Parnassius apollo]|uniref:(apollo) hypothetical protein n=1 Tax=Parnassius apollo TaxID=110799 RepID=A0A8S3WE72_PARAO|nr:unnamed protein product [Parnassius apollo]